MGAGTMGDKAIRELIQARLRSGDLPAFQDQSIFAGKGDMQRCVCCDVAVTGADIQYEVVLADQRTLVTHLHCFNLWCEESRAFHGL